MRSCRTCVGRVLEDSQCPRQQLPVTFQPRSGLSISYTLRHRASPLEPCNCSRAFLDYSKKGLSRRRKGRPVTRGYPADRRCLKASGVELRATKALSRGPFHGKMPRSPSKRWRSSPTEARHHGCPPGGARSAALILAPDVPTTSGRAAWWQIAGA